MLESHVTARVVGTIDLPNRTVKRTVVTSPKRNARPKTRSWTRVARDAHTAVSRGTQLAFFRRVFPQRRRDPLILPRPPCVFLERRSGAAAAVRSRGSESDSVGVAQHERLAARLPLPTIAICVFVSFSVTRSLRVRFGRWRVPTNRDGHAAFQNTLDRHSSELPSQPLSEINATFYG